MFEIDGEATPADILDSAARLAHARIEVDNAVLWHAAAWADRNGPETIHPDQPHIRGGARPVQLGGDGTPQVNDLAPPELGVVLGLSTGAAANLVADSLDLRHRLPWLWAKIVDCTLPGWQARKIAQRTRTLTPEQAAAVDRRLAGHAGAVAWTRLERFLEAAIAEVDAATVEREAELARCRRGAWTGQSNEQGVKTLYARMDTHAAIRLIGQVDRVADVLASRGLAGNADTRRATALGILADPLQASWLLAHHHQPHLFTPDDTDAPDAGDTNTATATPPRPAAPLGPENDDTPIREADIHPSQHDLPGDRPNDQPDDGQDHDPDRQHSGASDQAASGHPLPAGTSAELAAFQAAIDQIIAGLNLNQLRPTTQLVVHTAAETLHRGHGPLRCHTVTPRRQPPASPDRTSLNRDGPSPDQQQPMRTEDLGPMTLPTIRDWLLHDRITLQPVIDLNHPPPPVDTYEIPDRHRQHLALRHPASRFPWTTSTQGLDLDHVLPYLPPTDGGPPGQTGLHNLTPLSRREHRLFTHTGWQHRQPDPDTLLVRTPHGHVLLTNTTGTHNLGTDTPNTFPHTIWTAAAP